MASIYEQIGGVEALEPVVADFCERMLADVELAGFFDGADLARLEGAQVAFLSAALGGPEPYAGASMWDLFRGRGVAVQRFTLIAGYLSESLAAAGVPARIVQRIMAVIGPRAGDIATAKSA